MKKFICGVLSGLVMMTAVLFTGCSDGVFGGNYKQVDKAQVLSIVEYFQEREESLIDWRSGVSVHATQSSSDFKLVLDCKITSSLLDNRIGLGEWDMEINSGGRKEKTQLFYDGVYLYKKIKFAGNEQKTKGKATFDEVVNFTDIDDFDDLIGDALYMATEEDEYTTKFYLDESDNKLIKLKIKSNYVEVGYGEENVVGYFVFDKNYNLQAVKMEMEAKGESRYQKMSATIQKWSGNVSIPSNTSDYNEVDDILSA